MVDYECGVGMLELKHFFIYFVSGSEDVITIFPPTFSVAFVYGTVGVGFFRKFSATFFPQHICSIIITNGHRKHFDHMLKYLVFDITDKAVVKFQL